MFGLQVIDIEMLYRRQGNLQPALDVGLFKGSLIGYANRKLLSLDSDGVAKRTFLFERGMR
jgi:hypothetical protein